MGLVTSVGQADAATTISCGAVVSASITLANNVGPCKGDGIDVIANGITINLNGHTITGSDTTNKSFASNSEQIGVQLDSVHGVTVKGPGSISAFDAGVNVQNGYGNKVSGLTVHDNISHVLLTWNTTISPTPESFPCNYGDGILTDFSSYNTITGNTAYHNGPFDGIALVDTSTHNVVSNNKVYNGTVPNIEPDGVTSGPCGPFGANIVGPGRPYQDEGIRAEGPGATWNMITNNVATNNLLDGIAVHDNVCPGALPFLPNGQPPNNHNTIQYNTVTDNGFQPGAALDGIGVLSQGPTGTVCIANDTTIQFNVSNGNAGNGVFIGGRNSHGEKIIGNTTNKNGIDGIFLTGPSAACTTSTSSPYTCGTINDTITANTAHGNAVYDGFDGNPNCAEPPGAVVGPGVNHWSNDNFVVVNQPCVK